MALLQLEAHIERLDVGQVLQQVEVPLECGILGVSQAIQLRDEEVENLLNLLQVLVRSLGRVHPEHVRDAAGDEQLHVLRGMRQELLLGQVQRQRNVLLVVILVLAQVLERVRQDLRGGGGGRERVKTTSNARDAGSSP